MERRSRTMRTGIAILHVQSYLMCTRITLHHHSYPSRFSLFCNNKSFSRSVNTDAALNRVHDVEIALTNTVGLRCCNLN